jgi:hypothetical protein
MTIVNRDDISTSIDFQNALETAQAGERILNFATLTTTGDVAFGVFATANDVTVRNHRHIETSGLGSGGIIVLGDDARIENHGSVTTHGGIFGDGESFSDALSALGDRFHIANFGDVRVEGEGSSALVALGNDGSIVNTGRVTALSTDAIIVGAIGNGAEVVNRGEITVAGATSAGLFSRGENASVNNWGQVLVTAETASGIEIQRGNSHATNFRDIEVDAEGAFGIVARGGGHHITNAGRIDVDGDNSLAIVATGGRLSPIATGIEIVNSGHVSTTGTAAFGVALGLELPDIVTVGAESGRIDNRGQVETDGDGAAAIVMLGDHHTLTNSGRITTHGGAGVGDFLGLTSAAGVLVSGNDALVENTNTGVIQSGNAASAAVELNVAAAGMSSQLRNFGLVHGAEVAVLGGAGQETVSNYGRIEGDVDLGDGADLLVLGRGGTIAGDVHLGGGNDVVASKMAPGRRASQISSRATVTSSTSRYSS